MHDRLSSLCCPDWLDTMCLLPRTLAHDHHAAAGRTHSLNHSKAVCCMYRFMMYLCIADFQPNKAPPLSSVAVAPAGDIFTAEGPKPHSKPQALDKAGISKVSISSLPLLIILCLISVSNSIADPCTTCKWCHVSILFICSVAIFDRPFKFNKLPDMY